MSDQSDPQLTELLEAMPKAKAPPELALRLNAAYAHAMAPSRIPGAALAGLAAFLLLVAALLVSSSLADVLTLLSAWVVAVRALVQIGLDLALAALSGPSGAGLLASQGVLLIAGIGILARLMVVTAPHPEGRRV